MDKIIFGDNQFFGVNHMSEQTAIKQSQRYKSSIDIFNTLKYVNEIGVKSLMFTTHDQMEPVLEMIKKDKDFDDFKLYPCIPYAHKYANSMNELGIFETINKFTPGNKVISFAKGATSLITANPIPIMQLLVDSEMKLLKGMKIEGLFLQNVITDLLIGLGMEDLLKEFALYVEEKYNVKAGFITMNYVKLNDILVNKFGMKEVIICSNVNKISFRMNPNKNKVEEVLNKHNSYNIAMSILASGAIRAKEAVEYINSIKGVDSILFGASTPSHIKETVDLINQIME